MSDAVNHPSHYNSHPSGVECIDIVEHMTFNCGNTVKYLWRAGLKDGNPNIQDLKKARWYLDREIEKLEKEFKDACERFHPGDACFPGGNHPGECE